MSKEAMKLALEALNNTYALRDDVIEAKKALEEALKQEPVNQFNPDWDAMAVMVEEQQRMAKRIEELEAELAKQEQGEPVAWLHKDGSISFIQGCGYDTPLYTHPQPKQKQGEPAPELTNIQRHEQNVRRFLGTSRQEQGDPVANASTWFALVMNAAAELENASIFLRDEDAKRVAIRGAKYYRDQAKTLYTTPQQRKPLTREEIADLRHKHGITSDGRGIKEFTQVVDFVRDIEAYGIAPQAKPAVQEGWKLVPIEPTQGMLESALKAACMHVTKVSLEDFTKAYKAFLAAAPQGSDK